MISKHSTNILIPYTLEDSDTQKSMKLYCELFRKLNVNEERLGEVYNSNREIIFRGYYNANKPPKYFERNNALFISSKNVEIRGVSENSDLFINIYFPVEQIGTYIPKAILYHVNIYSYFNGRKVSIFSDILNSYNNLACTSFISNSIRYQEYQTIRVPDLEKLTKDILVGGEDIDLLGEFSNLLNISIQPVEKIDENSYRALTNTQAGCSIISIIDNTNIHLKNILDIDDKLIKTTITFNTTIAPTLCDYIHKMFDREKMEGTQKATAYLRYFLINKYEEIIYTDKSFPYKDIKEDDEEDIAYISFEIFLQPIISKAEKEERSLEDLWEEGLQIAVYLEVYDTEIDPDKIPEDEFSLGREMQIKSQPIALTKDLWNRLVSYKSIEEIIKEETGKIISKNDIKTKIEDMSTTYNVVNTITQQTIQVNQANTDSGITKPVFFRAYPVQDIILHRDMVENICINLDDYKGKTDIFYLKLCGNYFSEYSRTYEGIIFTINSSVITSNTGTYYICDKDKNFITSGKYKCE